jgi:hypothetical protein
VVGFILQNKGPGVFQSIPASQVSLIDTSAKSYAPTPGSTPTTGAPAPMAAGQELRILLYFVLAPGATPKTVTFAPFGPSVAPVQWNN